MNERNQQVADLRNAITNIQSHAFQIDAETKNTADARAHSRRIMELSDEIWERVYALLKQANYPIFSREEIREAVAKVDDHLGAVRDR